MALSHDSKPRHDPHLEWRETPPEALRDDIFLAAYLSAIMYWWQGPGHYNLKDLGSLTADNPACEPPKFGPAKPMVDAAEVVHDLQEFVRRLGNGAQADLWEGKQHAGLIRSGLRLLVAFRGTFCKENIMDDTRIKLQKVSAADCGSVEPPHGRVHTGFWAHLTRGGALPRLLERARELTSGGSAEQPADVLITGHSLGGAAATLFASLLARSPNVRVTLVTFGSPRVGDVTFARWLTSLDNLRHHRVQNELDLVTRVPYWIPRPGMYKHSQTYHVWLRNGKVRSGRILQAPAKALSTETGTEQHVRLDRCRPLAGSGRPLNLFFYIISRLGLHDPKADVRFHKMGSKTGYVQHLENFRWEGTNDLGLRLVRITLGESERNVRRLCCLKTEP